MDILDSLERDVFEESKHRPVRRHTCTSNASDGMLFFYFILFLIIILALYRSYGGYGVMYGFIGLPILLFIFIIWVMSWPAYTC